jgi:formamidopyrimidine-DNA glycosylase
MPELPEVETVRAGLSTILPGCKIVSVVSDNPKSFPNTQTDVDKFLIGSEVIAVRRRAKVLMIDLSSGYSLVIHLKMTGQLVYVGQQRFGSGHPNDSLISKLPDKSTRVDFGLEGISGADNQQARLFFNDQRKFGWVKLISTIDIPNIDFMQRVGPEPLGPDLSADILFTRLQRRKNTTIKAALLDQSVLAGIGNIYADESLWGAKIHPATLVKDLTKPQVSLLYKEIVFVLSLAIEQGGSSNSTYVDAMGKKGSYMNFARVFRREGQACPRCQTTIVKSRVATRGTHTCPSCQSTSG